MEYFGTFFVLKYNDIRLNQLEDLLVRETLDFLQVTQDKDLTDGFMLCRG